MSARRRSSGATRAGAQKYAAYLPAGRQRLAGQAGLARRREAAWEAARRAAAALITQFGATRVIAFGSIVDERRFGPHSDIDLAVAGVAPEAFFWAWAVADSDPLFRVDLVDLSDCSPALRERIAEEGVPL